MTRTHLLRRLRDLGVTLCLGAIETLLTVIAVTATFGVLYCIAMGLVLVSQFILLLFGAL